MNWPFPMYSDKIKKRAIYTLSLSPLPQALFYHIPKSLPKAMRMTRFLQAILPHQTACQKISRVIYEISGPLLSPSVLVREVPAHAKRRLLPIKVTGICKSSAVCVLHRFLSRAPDNFSQLFVRIVTTVFSFYFGHALKCITWTKCFFLIQHTTVSSTATVPTKKTQH